MATSTETNTYETLAGYTYCLHTTVPRTVTADIDGESMTLLTLNYGYGTFVAPGDTVTITGESKPHLVRCFNHAATTVTGGGEAILPLRADEAAENKLYITHQVWRALPSGTTSCELRPAPLRGHILSMGIIFSPTQDMPVGEGTWLHCPSDTTLTWLGGEIPLYAGRKYLIGITQLAPDELVVQILAVL